MHAGMSLYAGACRAQGLCGGGRRRPGACISTGEQMRPCGALLPWQNVSDIPTVPGVFSQVMLTQLICWAHVARLCFHSLKCKRDALCSQKLAEYAAPDDLAGYSIL